MSYGDESADVFLEIKKTTDTGCIVNLRHSEETSQDINISVLGKHNIRSITGAAAAGLACGMNIEEVAAALTKIKPVSGRMNILRGIRGCTITGRYLQRQPYCHGNSLKRSIPSLSITRLPYWEI